LRPNPAAGDEAPRAHPSPIPIGRILDLLPLAVPGGRQDPNHLAQQELTSQLAAVIRTTAQIEGGERHDAELWSRARHSNIGPTST
jgi:hypothetical protein